VSLSRRATLAGGLALLARTAMADERPGFEGTWGGADGPRSAQIIVLNDQVIGFYWDEDYTDATHVRISADARVLSFDFAGGTATLTRTGETALLEVRQRGRTISLALKRD
jgi:hypothetical protein